MGVRLWTANRVPARLDGDRRRYRASSTPTPFDADDLFDLTMHPLTARRSWRFQAVPPRHRFMSSFEPGEDWSWDFERNDYAELPPLAPPTHHPLDQTTPGPADRVPADWEQQLEARLQG